MHNSGVGTRGARGATGPPNISEGGAWPLQLSGLIQNPCACFLPIFIMYQTFFVKVRFKLLKYDLYKRIIVVTKFNNQSHTHNLYRWPLQHAIASYSTVYVRLCYHYPGKVKKLRISKWYQNWRTKLFQRNPHKSCAWNTIRNCKLDLYTRYIAASVTDRKTEGQNDYHNPHACAKGSSLSRCFILCSACMAFWNYEMWTCFTEFHFLNNN